jgi:hypothetical protein
MMKYQVLFLGPNADFWRGWQREGEGLTLEQAEMHAQECMDVVDAGGRICVVPVGQDWLGQPLPE